MTLVDTWASTAAGAFSLSENNLYTVEAFEEYFEHLKPGGVSLMIAYLDWAQGKDSEIEKNLQSAGSTPEGEVGVLNFRASIAASNLLYRIGPDPRASFTLWRAMVANPAHPFIAQ